MSRRRRRGRAFSRTLSRGPRPLDKGVAGVGEKRRKGGKKREKKRRERIGGKRRGTRNKVPCQAVRYTVSRETTARVSLLPTSF